MERAAITRYVGNSDLDAEVQIYDDNNKIVYIHVHYGYDCNSFTAGYTSIFDSSREGYEEPEGTIEYIEEFEELEETKSSKYANFYQIAERMINDIADSYNLKE